MEGSNQNLVRGLTLIAAIAVVIGTVIGTGVFLKARAMTCNAGSAMTVLAAWLAAGLLSIAGTLTYGELAAMMPEAGGEYVFIREAYGSRFGFIYGWTQFSIVFPASEAAKAVGFALFLNVLSGGTLDHSYFVWNVFGHMIAFGNLQIIALLIVVIVTAINCAAISVSGNIMSFLTGLKALFLLLIGLGAFFFASGSFDHFSLRNLSGPCEGISSGARGGLFGFGAAMLGALWAYDGWINLTIVAGEVKNPQRNLPVALIGGMSCILILYLFVNAAYFYVLTPSQIASVSTASSVATEVASRFLGSAAVKTMTLVLLISTLGSLYSGILVGARIPFAMSRDHIFFKGLRQLSNQKIPVKALIVQCVWICVLALSGSFDTLTDYAMFAAWIFYGIVTSSVFVFRRRKPAAQRPYRTIGYPFVPAIFIAVTLLLLLNTVWTAPLQALTGLFLIALGLPLYAYFASRKD